MKRILCFGDSNTWGYDPINFRRYAYDVRWPGKLQGLLSAELNFTVIEDGVNGRTTVWPDWVEGNKSGIEHLETSLESNSPLFGVFIMLGTNDLKKRFSGTVSDAALGLQRLIRVVKNYKYPPGCEVPEIVIISPPTIGKLDIYKDMFIKKATEESRKFNFQYKSIAEAEGCHFIGLEKNIQLSKSDGLHLEEAGHLHLAELVSDFIFRTWS